MTAALLSYGLAAGVQGCALSYMDDEGVTNTLFTWVRHQSSAGNEFVQTRTLGLGMEAGTCGAGAFLGWHERLPLMPAEDSGGVVNIDYSSARPTEAVLEVRPVAAS